MCYFDARVYLCFELLPELRTIVCVQRDVCGQRVSVADVFDQSVNSSCRVAGATDGLYRDLPRVVREQINDIEDAVETATRHALGRDGICL